MTVDVPLKDDYFPEGIYSPWKIEVYNPGVSCSYQDLTQDCRIAIAREFFHWTTDDATKAACRMLWPAARDVMICSEMLRCVEVDVSVYIYVMAFFFETMF